MNGDFKELLDAWTEYCKLLHNENLAKFDKLFNKLDKLPCDKRWGVISFLRISQYCLWVAVLFILKMLFLK